MAQKFLTEITLQALNNATTDTDKFLVSDSGTIKFRTGTQMLSDIVGYTPANDANVVHTTGNESIAGIKTFTQGNTTFSNANVSLVFTTGAAATADITINTTFTQFTSYGSFGYLFNGYSGGLLSNLLTLDQSGNGIFNANVRATSFTDKDNTLYYLNPASSSNLYDVTANKFVKQGGTSAQYLMADGSVSTGPSLTGYVPTSRTLTINGVTYDLSADRSWTVSVTETDTLATVVDRGNTTNGSRPISMDTSGGGISIKGSGGGWATGYYFTGTAGTYRGGFGALGGNDTLSYYWIGPAYNAYYAYVDVDQLFHINSVRSPIFYDSNSTAYYLDPASTSNLLGLTVVNTITGNISGSANQSNSLAITGYGSANMTYYQSSGTFAGYSGWAGYLVSNHGDGATYYNQTIITPFWSRPQYSRQQGSTTIYGPYTFWTSEDTITSSYNISAPVFQDYNNTSYYIDPASSSNIDSITTTRTRAIRAQSDGDYTTAALWTESYSTTTTGIAFHISGIVGKFLEMRTNGILYWNGDILLNSSNYTSYAVPTSRTITINGVAQDLSADRSWTVTAVETDTLATVTARGNVANTSIALRNSLLVNKSDGSSGGQLSYDSAINQLYLWNSLSSGYFSVYTNNSERLNISSSGVVTANVDMRAPIFYDSNDTLYYVDAANSTTAVNVKGKVVVNIGSSTASTILQMVSTSGSPSINSYYGVLHTSGDFYIGNPASTGNNLYGNNAYFSIFYDRNNSAYYIDAAATSNLLGLTVTNTISGNITGNSGTVSTITNRTNLMVNSLAAPALIDGLTTANFRSTLFNTTSNGYQISTARWNTTPSVLSGLNPYSTMIAWSGSDTQGFLAMDYNTPAARMGGGNGNNINWTRRVLLEDVWTNNKYFSSGGEIYGTALYDANDSTYYFDGSSTGDSIRCAGDIVAYYSDERLKDRKGNIENALEKVLSLNGFYYEPNETAQALGYKKKLEVGVSAQEVQAILPEIIKDAPIGGDYKTLDYGRLTPLLIEAIKEQQTQIDELKELVNKLINK